MSEKSEEGEEMHIAHCDKCNQETNHNKEGECLKCKFLTVQKLKDMKAGTIFATGTLEKGNNLHRDKELRWCACRGKGYHDWCIYYHLSEQTEDFIQRFGDKLFTESIIKELVPCDDEAWVMYRF